MHRFWCLQVFIHVSLQFLTFFTAVNWIGQKGSLQFIGFLGHFLPLTWPQWRCPILKLLSSKLPPKSETAPHPGWQDGTILGPGRIIFVFIFGHQNTIRSPLRRTPSKLIRLSQWASTFEVIKGNDCKLSWQDWSNENLLGSRYQVALKETLRKSTW